MVVAGVVIPNSHPFFGNAAKPPFDESRSLARPGFSYVFRLTIFVPRTHTFCENRSRLNDGREIGLKGSASKERFSGLSSNPVASIML